MSTSDQAVSTWAPLRVGIFRALWLAALVSNIGSWMQTVGAQWLLVSQPHASILVALVQTADMLPDVLLAYVGGVLAWVRARGLSVYQMVLFGAQAGGAVIWGIIAGPAGLVATFVIAAAVMAAGVATIRLWPLLDTSGIARGLEVYWQEPNLLIEPELQAGPVLVLTTYTVAPENEQEFFRAMSWVRRSRLRTGAAEWGLYRDGETARRFVECFVVPSWEEHLRQHRDRLTGSDRQHEEQADALSDPPSQTTHLFAADIPD